MGRRNSACQMGQRLFNHFFIVVDLFSPDKLLFVPRIIELKPVANECVISGTICKDMPLMPNLLKEYTIAVPLILKMRM